MPVVGFAYIDRYERLLHEHNELKGEITRLRTALADSQKRFDTLKAADDAERRKPIVLHGSAGPAQGIGMTEVPVIRPDQIPIPDEVVEAAARAAYEVAHKIDCSSDPDQWVDAVNEYKEHWRQQARAALAAALSAWPGATVRDGTAYQSGKPVMKLGQIILPLPQEPRDERV